MALSNEAAYYQAIASPFQRARWSKNSIVTTAGRAYSSWLAGGFPAAGATPTTAAAPTNATTGAMTANGDNLFNGTNRRLLKCIVDYAASASPGGMLTICDRVGHQGGLSGTTTGAQTTNLPTAALTRKTSGVGVQIGAEIYSAVGSTGTTITASYTNQAGSSGQATPTATFGGTGFNLASRIVILPLASGDTGVQAAASATIAASTLTAGNFGITLFYPLVHIPLDDILALKGYSDALYGFGCWFPLLDNNACLFGIWHTSGILTGVVQADFLICEDR